MTCPHCGAEIAMMADTTVICRGCGMRATAAAPMVDAAAIDNMVYNVRILLADLDDRQYRQIAAAFSPRLGHGPEDAIPFTRDGAGRLARRLQREGIACLHLRVHADGADSHSVVFANGQAGLRRALQQARREAGRLRARLFVEGPN